MGGTDCCYMALGVWRSQYTGLTACKRVSGCHGLVLVLSSLLALTATSEQHVPALPVHS